MVQRALEPLEFFRLLHNLNFSMVIAMAIMLVMQMTID